MNKDQVLRIEITPSELNTKVSTSDTNQGATLTDFEGVMTTFDVGKTITEISGPAFNRLMQQAGFEPVDAEPAQPPQWMAQFTERDNEAIALSRVYAQSFSKAGAVGHNLFLIVAKMAQMLDEAEKKGAAHV